MKDPRFTLDRAEIPEGILRIVLKRIQSENTVYGCEFLCISDVESFNPELDLVVLVPGHIERFIQSHIQNDISRITQGVTITSLAGCCHAEALVSRDRIFEQIWNAVHAISGR